MRNFKIIKNIRHIVKNVKFMILYSWENAKSRYFFAFLIILLDAFQPVFSLIMPKYIIDALTVDKDWHKVCFYIFLLVAVNLILNLFRTFISYKNASSQYKANVHFSISFAKIWADMDYQYIESSDIKDKLGQISENTHPIKFIDATVIPFFVNLIQTVGYAYIIFTLHPLLIMMIILCIAGSVILSKKREKLGYDYQPLFIKVNRKFAYIFQAMTRFDFAKEIRINGADTWLSEKYKHQTQEYISLFKENQKKGFILGTYELILSFVQTMVLYVYASYRVVTKEITVGTFSIYLEAVSLFISSFMSIANQLTSLRYLSHYVDDYKEYMMQIVDSASDTNKLLLEESGKHEIEFVNVSFKYPNTERYVLKNVSIKIESGKKLAVVGYNGSGKTTFVKLICKLYEPTSGSIFYNGRDISTIRTDEYRKILSVVFQDFVLFSFSVCENIVLNKERNEQFLFESIEKSGLSERIERLPDGVDTLVGKDFDENGIEFSGGEGQKLACARAYYKNANIIIFDEPTAELDPISEHQLYQKFNQIIDNKTAIYISHRLAAVQFCDNVAVFVDGKIEEYGSHVSLLERDGTYADMFLKQAQFYKDISL